MTRRAKRAGRTLRFGPPRKGKILKDMTRRAKRAGEIMGGRGRRPYRVLLGFLWLVGGSVVTDPPARDVLCAHAHVVWLTASPEVLLRRVREQGDLRPMAGRPDALGELRSILEAREGAYALADQAIDTEQAGIAGTVDAVLGALTGATAGRATD